MQKDILLGHATRTFWYTLVPIALALGVVRYCNSTPEALGPLGAFVREQQIPALILLVTLLALLIYSFRDHLPLSQYLAGPGASHVPQEYRQEFMQARSLAGEIDSIFAKHRAKLEQRLPAAVREQLKTAQGELQTSLQAGSFDPKRFLAAFHQTQDLADVHLAKYRKGEAREFVEALLTALFFAVLLRTLVVEAFKIPSGSMLPTLQINDHIFVSKFSYGPNLPFSHIRLWHNLPPERGDVMVFEFPDVPAGEVGQDFIKRVIALPGDTLEVENGHPIINGFPVPSCFVGKYNYRSADNSSAPRGDLYVEFLADEAYLTVYADDARTGTQGPYVVAPGEVMVMGDNRHNSLDSRLWHGGKGGGVPFPNIKGRALFVWLPWSRLGTPVMGEPQLPEGMSPELTSKIHQCLAKRPAATTPPPPLKPAR